MDKDEIMELIESHKHCKHCGDAYFPESIEDYNSWHYTQIESGFCCQDCEEEYNKENEESKQ